MTATTYGPSTPALTPARVTRIAKQAAPELRWSSEKGVRGVLVRVWDAPEDGTLRGELRLLNDARRLINATDLSATVVSLRSRKGRPVFRILVTSEAQEAAQMQEAADKRAAALADGMREVAEAQAAHEARVAEAEAAREARESYAADREQITADATRQAASVEQRVQAHIDAARAPQRASTADGFPTEESTVAELDPADGLSYRSIRAAAYEVVRDGAVIGRIVRITPPEHGVRVALWTAYRPGGGQVISGAGSRRAAGAALATAEPTLGSSPAAQQVAAREAASLPCWHVETAHGALYGVAALSLRDALQMTQDRLTEERSPDLPKRGQRVGTWRTAYGTVLCYRGPAE